MVVNGISACFFHAIMFSCNVSYICFQASVAEAKVSNALAEVVSRVVCIYS